LAQPMPTPTILDRIVHIDDEPETVWTIPDTMRTAFYQRHPDRLARAGVMNEAGDFEREFIFSFNAAEGASGGGDATIEYRLLENEGLLPADLTDVVDAVFILDLMRAEEGELRPVAPQTYRKLVAAGIKPDQIFVLTAYGRRTPPESFPGLPEGHELAKPIHPDHLLRLLFDALPGIHL
jgi:hypothetical protein